MKILLLNWRDPLHPRAGGAEVRLRRVYAPLAAAGHRVILYCSGWKGCTPSEVVDGIEIRRIGSDLTFLPLVLLRLRRWISEWGADLVVEDFNKLPFFSPWLSSVPVAVQMHHLWRGSIFREAFFPVAGVVWLGEQMLRLAYTRSRFSVVSPSTAGELEKTGISAGQITVIFNGVDREFYTPGPLSEPENPPYILWLGRIQKYKGIFDALRAFALLRERFPDLTLRITGEGPYRSRAEREVDRLGLRESVRFCGFVPEGEKRELLRGATAVWQTSWKEGWGLTVIEANSCGRTVIAADSPGLRDSVQNGETGLLYRAGAPADLAEKTTSLLADSVERRRLEENGVAWAARFRWEEASRETEAWLTSVAEKSKEGIA